jgi:PBP1b-binding outer membrane lipoprotein LpoB
MKLKKQTMALLFFLALLGNGCSSLKPTASSYFNPSPADEMSQAQSAPFVGGENTDDDGSWDLLYWALYFTWQFFAYR